MTVLQARYSRRSEVAPVVRAAFDGEIVYVPLSGPPGPGKQVLQLWVGGELLGALLAEPVGTGRSGQYPVRVRLLDEAHEPELGRLLEPVSTEAHDEDPTLTSRGVAPTAGAISASRAEPAPVELVGAPGTPVNPTTVFDPEELLRSQAPPRGDEDDTLTVPRASSRTPSFRRPDPEVDSGTLPLSDGPRAEQVSWNVRSAPTDKDPMCGRAISAGKYTLDSLIGSGAIGIVFKASHRELYRTVAIKVLNPRYRDDPELLKTFRTEARAASQLEHPNVARVYDYGQEPDGLVYIVMEYLSGYTLGSVLGARKRLTLARSLDVMIQTCAALSAAHERGIVHRDVKPDNIVLVPAQNDEGKPVEIVKVCDFGIAVLGTKTSEGVPGGTPEYVAPEQSLGEHVTAAADVYACGVVLYEMLTGEVPFTDVKPFRIFLKHQQEAPRPPSELAQGIPPALEAIVLRALEKSPANRFRSARELRAELRKVVVDA